MLCAVLYTGDSYRCYFVEKPRDRVRGSPRVPMSKSGRLRAQNPSLHYFQSFQRLMTCDLKAR